MKHFCPPHDYAAQLDSWLVFRLASGDIP